MAAARAEIRQAAPSLEAAPLIAEPTVSRRLLCRSIKRPGCYQSNSHIAVPDAYSAAFAAAVRRMAEFISATGMTCAVESARITSVA